MSECGQITCAIWHYEYDIEDWLVDPCVEEVTLADRAEAVEEVS